MTTLEQKAAELIKAGECCGFRYIEGDVAVGDVLANSHMWDDDTPTDVELPGTCAYDSWQALVDHYKYNRGLGKVVLITGDFAGRGMEVGEPHEVHIANAVVVAVMEW